MLGRQYGNVEFNCLARLFGDVGIHASRDEVRHVPVDPCPPFGVIAVFDAQMHHDEWCPRGQPAPHLGDRPQPFVGCKEVQRQQARRRTEGAERCVVDVSVVHPHP